MFTTREPVSLHALHVYKPLSLIIATLCESPAPDQLICSSETAERRLKPLRQSDWLPWLKGSAGLPVWAAGLAGLLISWARMTFFTVPPLFIVHFPLAYVVTNLYAPCHS